MGSNWIFLTHALVYVRGAGKGKGIGKHGHFSRKLGRIVTADPGIRLRIGWFFIKLPATNLGRPSSQLSVRESSKEGVS